MDTERQRDRSTGGGWLVSVARWLLLWRPPHSQMRVIDSLYLLVGLVVAFVVCIPILTATMLIAWSIASIMGVLGVPQAAQGLVILFLGIGGGLAAGFDVLVRISSGFRPRSGPS